ncbi:His Kinase A (phospho-acceptor) domain-containing protein [Sphingomonas gellani]|uniref:histidine kinase n=1 Tax=Sphingomonas gellani TaxID=1166340 RepID=A0A1H8JF73_9SPHN|nr:ATP-binding protein [Sphingomonas gellani]SEN79271.1 His Kinase A (phospho-acceptor) domain-containing protein [Sphingomonas gellani]
MWLDRSAADRPAERAQLPGMMLPVRAVMLGLVAIGCIWISAQHLELAPGVELYAAPLFYLLALRMFGPVGGLLAVPVLVAPTLAWWNTWMPLAMGTVHMLFCASPRLGNASLAHRTVLFHATIGVAALSIYLVTQFHVPVALTAMTVLRKVLLDLICALMVDLLCIGIAFDRSRLTFSLRRDISLTGLVEAATLGLLTLAAMSLFVGDALQFAGNLDRYKLELDATAGRVAEARPSAALSTGAMLALTNRDFDQPAVFARRRTDAVALGKLRLQCPPTTGTTTLPPDGSLMSELHACHVGRFHAERGSGWYVTQTGPAVTKAFSSLLAKICALVVLIACAFLFHLLTRRALERSMRIWRETLDDFGRAGVGDNADRWNFAEFAVPVRQFRDANRRFLAIDSDRRRLVAAATELKAAIHLRMLSAIRYDPASHRLSFTQVDSAHGSTPGELVVHANDTAALLTAIEQQEPWVEIRLQDDGAEWYMLILRERDGMFHWRSGCILQLRRSKHAQGSMLHQARLIELGGMASALSHELRQPLFTISLAAENGGVILANAQTEPGRRAREKFDRIGEQVERASSIIERISHYARVDSGADRRIDLADTIASAARFMRPVLVEHDVRVEIEAESDRFHAVAPQVGVEQVLVNAIQNAVDAIVSRRERDGGQAMDSLIRLTLDEDEDDDGTVLTVSDDGTGIASDLEADVFDAFLTTKPEGKGTGLGLYISRQIMREVGGRIHLAPRADGRPGCVLTLRFPTVPDPTPQLEKAA